eukprot:GHVQ01032799.1.p1 GENE.GHVQ01032799.1~~GHVQ01032799.1.p1  ORF type:complete len:298 (+),score=37.31 GHVQ01032799.1:246-1139(+)
MDVQPQLVSRFSLGSVDVCLSGQLLENAPQVVQAISQQSLKKQLEKKQRRTSVASSSNKSCDSERIESERDSPIQRRANNLLRQWNDLCNNLQVRCSLCIILVDDEDLHHRVDNSRCDNPQNFIVILYVSELYSNHGLLDACAKVTDAATHDNEGPVLDRPPVGNSNMCICCLLELVYAIRQCAGRFVIGFAETEVRQKPAAKCKQQKTKTKPFTLPNGRHSPKETNSSNSGSRSTRISDRIEISGRRTADRCAIAQHWFGNGKSLMEELIGFLLVRWRLECVVGYTGGKLVSKAHL